MKNSISKAYAKQKLIQILKSKKILFIGTDFLINSKGQLKMSQILKANNYKSYRPKSNLFKQVLKDSIFYNYLFLSLGPVVIVQSNTSNNLSSLKDLTINFFAIKVNNKIYTSKQLSVVRNLNYRNNVKNLQNTLDRLTKMFSITSSSLKPPV